MFRFRWFARIAVVLLGVSCVPIVSNPSLAMPPQVADPTPNGMGVAFRQALDEIGEASGQAGYDSLFQAWINYFESLSPEGRESANLLARYLDELRALQPVEYVRICDAFGTNFFSIPGSETCLRLGGRLYVGGSDDPDFGPTQEVGLGTGWGGFVDLGINVRPTNANISFTPAVNVTREQFSVQELINLLAGPNVNASGELSVTEVVPTFGVNFHFMDRWAVGVLAGGGAANVDFSLNAGAFGSASGNEWTWAGRFGAELQHAVAKCASVVLGAYLNRVGSISASPAGGGPSLQVGPFTSIAVGLGMDLLVNCR